MPYTFNYAEFLDIEGDPRYYFKEGYNPKYKTCKYTCELKPLGVKKGAYRILNGNYIKICDIDNLFEVEEISKTVELINKLIIGTPINEVNEKLEFEIKPIISFIIPKTIFVKIPKIPATLPY